jgi:hypothetical protein
VHRVQRGALAQHKIYPLPVQLRGRPAREGMAVEERPDERLVDGADDRRVVDINPLRALAPPSLRPRSQAVTPPRPARRSPAGAAGSSDAPPSVLKSRGRTCLQSHPEAVLIHNDRNFADLVPGPD